MPGHWPNVVKDVVKIFEEASNMQVRTLPYGIVSVVTVHEGFFACFLLEFAFIYYLKPSGNFLSLMCQERD